MTSLINIGNRSNMNKAAEISDIKNFDKYRRTFQDISSSEKILNTGLLMMLGIGYLVALCNIFFSYQTLDGKDGFSIEDVIIKYHGSSDQSRLETAINGAMEANLKDKSDKKIILKWIENGAIENDYDSDVAPIINRDCLGCHNPAINPALPNLTNFRGVSELAKHGGISIPILIRNAHIHLFGISFLLFFIGKIFLLSEINTKLKRILLILPFSALALDVFSWFLARNIPVFGYSIIFFGALLGLSVGIQIVIAIYQMWFLRNIKY